ncbi:MAG: Hsp20/alpha crystallin family protein [Bacteroidales bacterium]|nr:Hsp20/alpha crystallin family protein [Bacteroidales bacterium]MBN2818273.1 Hsp20/alpha crystallin family protein [Bacteroidales bacterium]
MTLARLTDDLYRNKMFPSLFDRFFEGDLMVPMDLGRNSWNYAGTNSTLPAVNIKENDDEFLIEVAAPGLKKDDFKINYENGRLTISSEKKEEFKDEKDGKVNRKEFSYQSFQRSFTIAEEAIDAEKIKAKYSEGILHLTLPKREEIKPKPAREIKIS